MESPFNYIKEIAGDSFVGCNDDLVWLSSNMLNSKNMVIIAPPKTGKTSLICKAQTMIHKQDAAVKFCYVDLFNVRDIYSFLNKLANEAIKSISETTDDWELYAEEFLFFAQPQIVINRKTHSIKLVFNKENLENHYFECISIFNDYAERYNTKMVVCLENFQNILEFDNSLKVQKLLAKPMKESKNVAYIISGNRKNALKEMFQKPRAPFNNFGDICFPEPIDEKLFTEYLVRLFSKSGRAIKKEHAEKVCSYVQYQPYYVQLYANIIWNNTRGFVTEQTIDSSKKQLLDYCINDFMFKIDGLSNSQLNYLHAVVDGIDRFSSAENLAIYNLHSSANVARVKDALIKKEILEYNRHKPLFIDPVFELWLKEAYFN